MVLGNLFTGGQSNTGSVVLRLAVQPLEDIENLRCMLLLEANSVVPEFQFGIGTRLIDSVYHSFLL